MLAHPRKAPRTVAEVYYTQDPAQIEQFLRERRIRRRSLCLFVLGVLVGFVALSALLGVL